MFYRVIQNSVTHCTKSVPLNGGKDSNKRPTNRKRNPRRFFYIHVSRVRPFWHVRRDADIPFPPIRTAACHDWFPIRQRWFVFVSLWGKVKESVFLFPLPQGLPQLRRQIMAAISETDRNMLRRAWPEMDYRLDVCRVNKGRQTEHWSGWANKNLESFSFHLQVACWRTSGIIPFIAREDSSACGCIT